MKKVKIWRHDNVVSLVLASSTHTNIIVDTMGGWWTDDQITAYAERLGYEVVPD